MQRIMDAGDIDPANLSEEQQITVSNLIEYLRPELGELVYSGYYTIPAVDKYGNKSYTHCRINTPFIYRGILDPSDISGQQRNLLDDFFFKSTIEGLVPAGNYCLQGSDSRGVVPLELYVLKYGILARHKTADVIYFDIIDQHLARGEKGSFGRVYTLFGSVKPKYSLFGELIFSPGENRRVAKIQLPKSSLSSDNLHKFQLEFNLMKRLKYLSARDLQLTSKIPQQVYMSMRKLNGETLRSVIKSDRNNKSELNIYSRLSLSIRLLRELERYFLENNILHRDIKPENIMVECVSNYWVVKFIDLGLSIDSATYNIEPAGTPLYIPPEAFHANYNQLSEIYSLARVIGLIWRDKDFDRYHDHSIEQFISIRRAEASANFDMFEGVSIPAGIRDLILKTLKQMTSLNRNDRPNLQESIIIFENIRISYYLSQAKNRRVKRLCQGAKTQALNLLDFLTKAYRDRHRIKFSLGDFRVAIIDAVSKVSDENLSFKLFIDMLGIRCLYPCKNKAGVVSLVNQITMSFTENYDDWWVSLNKLQDYYKLKLNAASNYDPVKLLQLKCYLKDAEKFQQKIIDSQLDLDSLIEIIDHMMHKVDAYYEAYLYFASEEPAATNTYRYGNMKQ